MFLFFTFLRYGSWVLARKDFNGVSFTMWLFEMTLTNFIGNSMLLLHPVMKLLVPAGLWEMVCKDKQPIGSLGREFDERALPLGKNQR